MLEAKFARAAFLAAVSVCLQFVLPAPSACAQDTTPPVLSVPFHTLEEMAALTPYGIKLRGSGVANPTYEVGLRSYGGSLPLQKFPLRAACAGMVTFLHYQPESKDYELATKPTADSIYEVLYDHLVKPKVREGDSFEAGALLGYLGDELQINRTDPKTHKVISICPRELGTPEFNRVFDDLLAIGGFRDSAVCLGTNVIP